MTVREIHDAVREHKKVSRTQLYHYFKALKITPIGAQQKPARYPDNTANLVLIHLGFIQPVKVRFEQDAAGNAHSGAAKLPSMSALRAVGKKARGK